MLSFTSCLTKKSPRLPGEFKNLSNDNITNLKFDIVFYQNLTKSLQDQTKITNFLRTFVMSRATWLSNVYLVELAIHNWQNFSICLFICLIWASGTCLLANPNDGSHSCSILTKSLQDQTRLMTKITNFLRTFGMSRAIGLSNVYFVANLVILDITWGAIWGIPTPNLITTIFVNIAKNFSRIVIVWIDT